MLEKGKTEKLPVNTSETATDTIIGVRIEIVIPNWSNDRRMPINFRPSRKITRSFSVKGIMNEKI